MKFRVFEIKTGTGVTDDADFVVDSSGRLCDVDNFCRLVEVDPKKCRVEYTPEWIEITDDPKTWPELNKKVIAENEFTKVTKFAKFTGKESNNRPYMKEIGGAFFYASRWMPAPQGPKEEK